MVLLNSLVCEAHNVLASVVLHQIQVLESRYHVLLTNARLLTDLTERRE